MWNDYLTFAKEHGLTIGGESTEEKPTFTQEELNTHRGTIEVIIKARMAQRLYRSEAWYPVFNSIDPLIHSALGMWNEAADLAELSGKPRTN